MKIICMYLPQYHEIPENNEWWGDGYTEWVAVKKAKSLFKGHQQPVVPLNNNYYDLVKDGIKTWKWQAALAKKYNIYGFCVYHYWFNGKMLLEKPMEILLDHPEIEIHYSLCWANEPWARNWDGKYNDVLMPQSYGDRNDWVAHYNYMLKFFEDTRYIKIDNKPVVHIYKSTDIPNLKDMQEVWNKMAVESGFNGIYWVSAKNSNNIDTRTELFDHYYYFEPSYTLKYDYGKIDRFFYMAAASFRHLENAFRMNKTVEKRVSTRHTWKQIEKRPVDPNISLGTFFEWDNTPRRGFEGTVYIGGTPVGFRDHIKKLSKKIGKNDFLYINAWNEWGEGAHLEPDTRWKYGFLKALRDGTLE